MATSGPGIDIPGEWFIAGAPASAFTAAGASFGAAQQLVVDNTVSPGRVTVQGNLVSPSAAEFYSLIAVDTVVAAGAAIPIGASLGPSAGTAYAQRISSTVFQLTGNASVFTPSLFQISWQLSATESPAQTQLKCLTGSLNGVTNAVLPETLTSRSSATDLLTGNFFVLMGSATATFSIVNSSGGNLTLTGNAGGANAVSANVVVRRLV